MRSNTEASYHYEYKYKKTCEKSSEKVLFVIVIERSNKRVFFPGDEVNGLNVQGSHVLLRLIFPGNVLIFLGTVDYDIVQTNEQLQHC